MKVDDVNEPPVEEKMPDVSSLTAYVNVLVYEGEGKILEISQTCGGHSTMEEAIECAEMNKPTVNLLVSATLAINPGRGLVLTYGIVKMAPVMLEKTNLGGIGNG